MVGWLVSFLLLIAGAITGLFIANDALNFEVIQMAVAVVLFALLIFIIAFWSSIKNLFKRK